MCSIIPYITLQTIWLPMTFFYCVKCSINKKYLCMLLNVCAFQQSFHCFVYKSSKHQSKLVQKSSFNIKISYFIVEITQDLLSICHKIPFYLSVKWIISLVDIFCSQRAKWDIVITLHLASFIILFAFQSFSYKWFDKIGPNLEKNVTWEVLSILKCCFMWKFSMAGFLVFTSLILLRSHKHDGIVTW